MLNKIKMITITKALVFPLNQFIILPAPNAARRFILPIIKTALVALGAWLTRLDGIGDNSNHVKIITVTLDLNISKYSNPTRINNASIL